ncbi:MAG: outer membrane lipoprotein carrier protein LolA [Nitrospirae bacterium]|nr:outer membrane lipoprotein carrier protein LolA [Nitrospirota bacterium]
MPDGSFRIRNTVCGIVLVFVMVFIPGVLFGEENSADVLSRVQLTYKGVSDLTSDFVQQSYIKGFDARNFRGKLYLKKPGQVRWDYTKPVKQNIVINGDKIILYFHEQKQAIIQKVSAHPDAEPAMGLLSNIEKWDEDFIITVQNISGGLARLKLIPRKKMMVKEVVAEIDKETSYINKLILYEISGNKVSFNFSGIKINSGIKGSLFEFKIPAGTEVLEY